LKKIDVPWEELIASYAGLSDSQMDMPGVMGSWSVKDILGHITTWEEEAIKYLPMIQHGKRPPRYSLLYGGIDAFNALMSEKKRAMPLSQVLSQQIETHQRLIELVQNAPDGELSSETRYRKRVRLDTYSHYPHHTQAILEWRKTLS
jgi:hypothetical protein